MAYDWKITFPVQKLGKIKGCRTGESLAAYGSPAVGDTLLCHKPVKLRHWDEVSVLDVWLNNIWDSVWEGFFFCSVSALHEVWS